MVEPDNCGGTCASLTTCRFPQAATMHAPKITERVLSIFLMLFALVIFERVCVLMSVTAALGQASHVGETTE
ncbi:hypothetical protein C0Z18_04795 [Trinickia dabaoshanensis]|uniref:Uncharacterized protein n=1 Tax=Trinickia dabaoshanensis TaxID=564714 RepID=A0A2N7VZT1_9BURK|nr:hypothetical protein C0Z18_04795 [Trinickia dabaoshanensis]